MSRNNAFTKNREPFQDNDKLELARSRVNGPFSFLNPTKAQYHHTDFSEKSKTEDSDSQYGATASEESTTDSKEPFTVLWRSRDNRKGRHPIQVKANAKLNDPSVAVPASTRSFVAIQQNTIRMLTVVRPWDISWLVAQIFTWGSVVWVINGFFEFLPLIAPSTEFKGEIAYAGGITAFVGAIVFFETGSILLMLEAVNENHAGCFGWALENLMENATKPTSSQRKLRPAKNECTHHHQNKRNLVGSGSKEMDSEAGEDGSGKNARSWKWLPTWYELQAHYCRELGFLACLAQFLGATIFGISGITALPGIQNHLSQPVLNGIYWVPQIVGGTGFIISGLLFMIETQMKWYIPAYDVLGWHIGFWNLIGAFGFTLCGALGPAYGNSGAQYQASCATFWGSWAFLIGSLLQLYESVQKHPVEIVEEVESSKL